MQDKVKHILLTKRHCRDNDVYLLYEIWSKEFAKYNLDIKSYKIITENFLIYIPNLPFFCMQLLKLNYFHCINYFF